jgi:hypothetical protein
MTMAKDADVFRRIAREASDEEWEEWERFCEGELDHAWAIIEDAVHRRPSLREKMVLWLHERIEMLREIDELGKFGFGRTFLTKWWASSPIARGAKP